MIGQVGAGIAQPWFQIVGPKYSELWFGLKGRTTATAIIAIANPGKLFISSLSSLGFARLGTYVYCQWRIVQK